MTNFAVLRKKAVTQAGIAVSEMKRETDKTVFGSTSPFFSTQRHLRDRRPVSSVG